MAVYRQRAHFFVYRQRAHFFVCRQRAHFFVCRARAHFFVCRARAHFFVCRARAHFRLECDYIGKRVIARNYAPLPPMRSSTLRASIVPVADLDARRLAAMWELFRAHYEGVEREVFDRDLRGKDHAILLHRREDDVLGGFSTITSFECTVEGRKVVGVFSGDTIVEKRYWRQTALQRAFLSYVMKVKLRNPRRPVFWFLISKGYKTYLLLAKNFPEYWPRYDAPTPPWPAAVIDAFARMHFPRAWRPSEGLLCFDSPAGRLRGSVAPMDESARDSPHARFFEEANPGHERGDELCCIGTVDARLWIHYMSKLGRRFVLERLGRS